MELNIIERAEHRQDLKDYYKFIRRCKLCKKIYGTDFKWEKIKLTCPMCLISHGLSLEEDSKK